MTPSVWGAVLGVGLGLGLLLVAGRVVALGRPRMALRVLPYVRDLPQREQPVLPPTRTGAFWALFGPSLGSAALWLSRVLGGNVSIRRRLERANLPMTVQEFRVEQVLWGMGAFGCGAAASVVFSVRSPGRAVPLLVLCLVAFVFGVLLRENRLSAQVVERERRILVEFPTIAELLALAVGAGEGPVAALDRVVTRSQGELSAELGVVLADIRTGRPVTEALDAMARRSGVPVVARFAEGMAVAIERGTPLAGVLHARPPTYGRPVVERSSRPERARRS